MMFGSPTICDADENVIGPANKALTAKNGTEPKFVQDIRRIFDDKEIDAVSIATPNHWHSLATIWAVQAGKDVYVEKPVSHNVLEGRKAVEAARKYDRIVQAGTQCRSHKGIQDAMEFLHSGKLGNIYMAKGLCYKPRGSIGHKADSDVPAGVDYNLWTGPAPMKPFNANRFHYNWHWFWDTGNGDLGNQGIHQMDLARWGLNKNEFPKTVMASGGRFGYTDDGQTPNTELVAFEYDDCELQFEVRGLGDQSRSEGHDRRHLLRDRGPARDHELYRLVHLARPQARTRPQGIGRRRPFRQLHQSREGPRPQDPEWRHRGRPPFERLLPPRQYQLPTWPEAPHQPVE